MKLRNLNGAIRKVEGAPTVGVMTPLGYIHVPVQKTGLLDALKTLSDDPQVETHMEVSEDGRLVVTAEGRAIIEKAERVNQGEDMTDDQTLDIEDAIAASEELEDEDESLAALTDAAASDDLDDLLG